jgi:hypothetical protein
LARKRGRDLPSGYRGPFRIYPVDPSGEIALACAGWRTDGQKLAEYLQSVDRKERQVFGTFLDVEEHGSFLACQASQILADRCVQDGNRPMSCLGLLASGGGGHVRENDKEKKTGCLYLIDSTGTYRVRAHAVGGGSLAGKLNDILRDRDWRQLPCNEVAKELLCVLFDDWTEDNDEIKTTLKEEVPDGSLVELVRVGTRTGGFKDEPPRQRMNRLFASTLLGTPS